MDDLTSLKKIYKIVRTAFPGEIAAFCCDLGDSWLFKFIPESEKDNPDFINGYFATIVNKETGEISQYNMLANMQTLMQKENLADLINK